MFTLRLLLVVSVLSLTVLLVVISELFKIELVLFLMFTLRLLLVVSVLSLTVLLVVISELFKIELVLFLMFTLRCCVCFYTDGINRLVLRW